MVLFLKLLLKNSYLFLTEKNRRVFHWLVLLHGNDKRYKQKQVRFLGYTITIADALSFIWQFKEIYTEEIYSFKTNKTNPLIYDCGSNIGMSCLYFKKLYPKATIKAFEADAKIASLLQSNINQNKLSDIMVTSKAVWINDNGVELASDGADGASIVVGENKTTKTPSVRLSTLLEQEEEIDFLKMDIEGAETAVIKDCEQMLYKIKNIFIEYHSYTNSAQELHTILDLLHRQNFRYYTLPVNIRRRPFVDRSVDKSMDFQINIFAYKQL